MNNPLLEQDRLPAFNRIRTEHIEPAINTILAENRTTLHELLAENDTYTWDNLVIPLQENQDRLNRAWSPVCHLHSVADNDQLRQVYSTCLEKLTDYETELGQNQDLYLAYTRIAESSEFEHHDHAQQKIITNALLDFHLSGIGLSEENRKHFKDCQLQLSKLQTRFEENLLDATHGWNKHISDQQLLAGLPESVLELAAQQAKNEKKTGWVVTLELPLYLPVMQYAENRELRRELYHAYVTRASNSGPDAGKWDNSQIMVEILRLRQQIADLLEFDTYAHYSLAKKMAGSPEEVLEFLQDLVQRSRAMAENELDELRRFAKEHDRLEDLQTFDILFYTEKLKQHKFDFSQETLRPYFPASRVLAGLFDVVKRLFGLTVREQDNVEVWHPDVRFFEIYDEADRFRGSFYLDLYARPHKRGGAWMDECIVRKKSGAHLQSPVAYLTCNFTPPVCDRPSLLTHDEVMTLYHEFGHGLHHLLTLIDYPAVSGINGVPWDAVELPSQLMENWCWEKDALDLFARHYRTGKPLPDNLLEKLQQTRTFHSGMQMLRQLEFALFDFHLHYDRRGDTPADIQDLLDEVRNQVAVILPPNYNRFQNSFSHIFSGGYAAGYYSYKWAEVLSADAFSKFEENGIFDRRTGQEFLHSILEQGGSREPMELFINFRGRKPSIEPLLRHSGIINQGAEIAA